MGEARDRRYIDLHHHVVPPVYAAFLRDKGWTLPLPPWSPESALASMDRFGIERAVLSLTTPGLYGASEAEGRTMARAINEACAEATRRYPDRFCFFATLPLPDVHSAVVEATYALDDLGADGVVAMANSRGTYLGHEQFALLYEVLNARRSILFVHPTFLATRPVPETTGDPCRDADLLYDTTWAAVDYVKAGYLEQYPYIRVLLSHAGGFLPVLAERIAPKCGDGDRAAGMRLLRRFYFDLALSSGAVTLPSLLAFAEPDHVVFGTDLPFATDEVVSHFVRELESFELSGQQRGAIERGNAEFLLAGTAGAGWARPAPSGAGMGSRQESS
jgi:6-methylsalicylate decarboxylase